MGLYNGANTYTYDGLARLTSACADWDDLTETCTGDSWTYEYDAAGNAARFDRWDADGEAVETVAYVYNGANQLECVDTNASGDCDIETPYSYDAYGNLLDDGVNSYVYDAAMRLVSVNDGVSTTVYAYNGDGDRMSQTVDSLTTTYVIDIATPLTMVLLETTGTESIYYLHVLGLVGQSDGTTAEFFAEDGLGSVRQILDLSAGILYGATY